MNIVSMRRLAVAIFGLGLLAACQSPEPNVVRVTLPAAQTATATSAPQPAAQAAEQPIVLRPQLAVASTPAPSASVIPRAKFGPTGGYSAQLETNHSGCFALLTHEYGSQFEMQTDGAGMLEKIRKIRRDHPRGQELCPTV